MHLMNQGDYSGHFKKKFRPTVATMSLDVGGRLSGLFGGFPLFSGRQTVTVGTGISFTKYKLSIQNKSQVQH